jgi:hypothetical protein
VNGAITLAVCRPPAPSLLEKWAESGPSIFFAAVALVLSVWTLIWNLRRDDRLRQQSVLDDYWLRKIVSPICIEPFLGYINTLPAHALQESHALSPGMVQEFFAKNMSKLEELRSAFNAVKLIGDDLYPVVDAEIDAIGESLTVYVASLNNLLSHSSRPNRSWQQTYSEVTERAFNAIRAIQAHQVRLSSKVGRGKAS